MKLNLRHTARIVRILLTMFVKTSAMLNAYDDSSVQNAAGLPQTTISTSIRAISYENEGRRSSSATHTSIVATDATRTTGSDSFQATWNRR